MDGSRHQSAHRDRGRRTVSPSRDTRPPGWRRSRPRPGAKIGSIYHFFAGKEALATEVIATSRARIRRLPHARHRRRSTDPAEALACTFNRAADDLVACDYADVCPSPPSPPGREHQRPLRQATSEVFGTWLDGLTPGAPDRRPPPATSRPRFRQPSKAPSSSAAPAATPNPTSRRPLPSPPSHHRRMRLARRE